MTLLEAPLGTPHDGVPRHGGTAEPSVPPLDLPADRPRPRRLDGGRVAAGLPIDEELAVALAAAADRCGVHTPDLVLAGWTALLARTAGQARFALAFERSSGAVETAVEVDFAAPFADLAAAAAAARRGGGGATPIAAGVPAAAWHEGGGRIGAVELRLELAGGRLRHELAGGRLRLDAAADRFDAATVERWGRRLLALLAGAAAAPWQPLADLPLLAPDERRQLFAEWNPPRPVPPPAPLDALFAAQARRTPQVTALVWGERRLTYAELAAEASRLAARLRLRGVGAESRVAVFLDRRPELIATLLGVLEAGAAYVPLDPAYPTERLAFMLADSGARVVVTRADLAERLPAVESGSAPVDTLLVDGDEVCAAPNAAAGGADLRPDAERTDDLAYLIYTSGSTGRPKGVAIAHSAAAALLSWAADTFSAAERAGVLAATSVCFDLSVFEIFLPLVTGGTVVLADDALALASLPAAAEVTLVNTVPSAATELLRRGGFPASVRTVNLAGEPLPRELADGLYALGTVERVWDLYGPSEDTTYSTAALVPRDPARPVTIGRAIPGSRAWLVDRRLRPVGVGVPGELLLGGAGLARGYLGRPGLTAERFVPDPFAGKPGARLYRTGDLARWLPHGELDFLGRIDHQVKVRGFRIELGEIEAVLAAHSGVEATVAAVREPVPGDRRIAAYWTPVAGGPEPSVRELRAHLAARLPAYMVPSYLVRLEALPLTPSGKVDRRGLPAPEGWRDGLETPFAPPEDERQKRMAALWAELLGVEAVGVDDDLIALGGHSLLAARLAARSGDLFDVEVPVAEVCAHPTVRGLVDRVGVLARRPRRLPPLEPVPRDRPLPLSFQQRQVWFIHRLAPGNLAYNFQYTVRFRGRLDHAVLVAALGEIVRRHEVLRTAFVDGAQGPEQRVGAPWPIEVPRLDLAAVPPERREALAEELVGRLVRRRFDPGQPPLVAWALLELADDESMLVQAEHHFVHDGWSIAVFLGELAALYDAFVAGRPSPLPDLPVQFADFAVWQHRALAGDLLAEQLAYWTGRLADPPPPLELPLDRPRPRQQSFDGDRLDVELPPALYRALRDFSRRHGVTLFVTLFAAFQALLARVCGSRDFLIGSGVANRRLPASEKLIGMIVNTLVLRAELGGDPTFEELLGRTRNEVIGAQTHPDLPLERLVAALQPERDLSRNPLFQVMFSFHDAPVPDLELAGLSGRLLERHNGSAKSDFNVIVRPRAEQRLGRRASDEDDVLRVLWEFSTALFDRATVEGLWQRYQRLLAAVVADPSTRLSALPLASDEELRRVAAWNETGRAWGAFRPIHRRVAERAAAAPGATALIAADGRRTTYGELAARARRLAGHLAARGVRRGDTVAVLAGRTPEMVAGLLAVIEAGGAYLPLDPATPAERVATLVADAGARLLLVDRPDAPVPVGVEAVRLDRAQPEAPPAPPFDADPTDLAYVIFTSGSTGRPKGVAIPHGGLANLVDWHLEAYRLAADDRAALVAGLGFDAAVWELWPALAAGAAICLPDEALRADPRSLVDWLVERQVTVAFLPTPVAEAALAVDWPAATALRRLLTGGDVLHAHPPAGLPFELINHYGPTEGTVVASAGAVAAGGAGLPDIGRPIANVRLLVLDEVLRPVPPGVPGALYLGGAGLARGYVGRPGWTAESFVPDPSGDGARLYATGDRARWTRDGRLVFLGRRDGQVKVRGVRIELGEVEAALCADPGVAAAVAAAPIGPGGEPWLVAWWQPAPSAAGLDEEALRRRLARRLPEAMLPQRLVRLDRLPLTPNGKVDRRALPAPEAAGEESWVAPGNAVEELIAGVWQELLGRPRIGARDHFFRLGGHSLAAARLATRLGDALDVPLPLSLVFEHPVLADFAAALDGVLAAAADEPAEGRPVAAAPPAGAALSPVSA